MVEVHLSGTHDMGSCTCLIRLKTYKSGKQLRIEWPKCLTQDYRKTNQFIEVIPED